MFWEKSGELFRCLPLIEASGEEQLQFMYDIASVNEESVDIPMLTARYAFLRSTSSVGAVVRNGKSLGGADIEQLLMSYKPNHCAGSCDELIRAYCDNESVYEICECCPCSSTYKNMHRKEEFEVLAYILSNGGPVYVDLQDLGIDDLPSLIKSQEPVPFGKVANKFVPYPLFQKVAEYMIESAFACVSADAFWEGFSGVVYSRKAKQYKYGKIDETALSYIKNIVYSFFDDRYKELNFDSLRVLMGSTSVGDDELVSEVSSKAPAADSESLSVSVPAKTSGVVISETDNMVVLGSFFDDERDVDSVTKDGLNDTVIDDVVCDNACPEDVRCSESEVEKEVIEALEGVDGKECVSESCGNGEDSLVEDEPFLAILGIKEETPAEIITDPSLVDAWDALDGKSVKKELPIKSKQDVGFSFKPKESLAYIEADNELICGGFLLKKKSGVNLDVLPSASFNTSPAASSKKSVSGSLFESITGHAFGGSSSSHSSVSMVPSATIERVVEEVEKAESLGADKMPVTVPCENSSAETTSFEPSKDEDDGFIVTVNGGVDEVDISEPIENDSDDDVVEPSIQLYRECTADGIIEPIDFKKSKVLCPGAVLDYAKTVCVVKSSDERDFINFCRVLEGATEVAVEVARVGDEVGLLIFLDKMYFTSYNSDAYGILHSLFNNRNVSKICYDMFVLAQYVYMYDSVFENVRSILQYSGFGVDITSVSGLEDYISFVRKQAPLPAQGYSEYLAYMATHALSSDVDRYVTAAITRSENGFSYSYKGALGVGERCYGAVFELSGFNKDVDSGVGFDKIVYNAIRILFFSHIIHKYNLKIVEVGSSSIKVYAPYNIYEVLDMLILAFSNSIKQLTGGVPSFVCVPTFVKKPE